MTSPCITSVTAGFLLPVHTTPAVVVGGNRGLADAWVDAGAGRSRQKTRKPLRGTGGSETCPIGLVPAGARVRARPSAANGVQP